MTATDIFAELDTLRAKLPKQGDEVMTLQELEEVENVFNDGFHPDLVEDYESCVWQIAAKFDLRNVIAFLLKRNVGNWRWTTEDSAMMEAVRAGNCQIVQMMLEHGWDPNHATDVVHESPLTYAAEIGREDIFFLLIDHGAKLEYQWNDDELYDEEACIDVSMLIEKAEIGRNERILDFLRNVKDNVV